MASGGEQISALVPPSHAAGTRVTDGASQCAETIASTSGGVIKGTSAGMTAMPCLPEVARDVAAAATAADAIRRFDSLEHRGRRLRVNDADDKPPARAPRPPRPGGPPPLMRTADFPRDFPPDFSEAPFRKNGGSRRGLRAKKRSLR